MASCPVRLLVPGDTIDDWKGVRCDVVQVEPTSGGAWLHYLNDHGPGVQWMPTEVEVDVVFTAAQNYERLQVSA